MAHPDAVPRRASHLQLWTCFLGGAVLWFVHFLAIWAIGEFGCLAGWQATTLLGIHLVAWLVLGVTVLVLAAGGALMVMSVRLRRAFDEPQEPALRGADHYMARGGLWSNAVFLFIIVVQTLPVITFLQHC
jgi:hypothetical protein